MSRRFLMVALLGLVAVSAACGESQKVGSEKLLEGIDNNGSGGPRLGERTPEPVEGTPKPLTADERTPTPTVTPKPEVTPSYFDVTLVANSPYYQPGNRIAIKRGVTLRVTNKDMTAERSDGRSFTDKSGTFHSGLLKPGASWTYTFTTTATFQIVDEGLTFATAQLQVVP